MPDIDTQTMSQFIQDVAGIFDREPDDAADYKDAAGKIYSVWKQAKYILGEEDAEEGIEDSE